MQIRREGSAVKADFKILEEGAQIVFLRLIDDVTRRRSCDHVHTCGESPVLSTEAIASDERNRVLLTLLWGSLSINAYPR